MEHDFSVEEMLDMPIMGEVLDVHSKTDDYNEPNYIESDNFTLNARIGEPKVSADKELDPNNLGEADNESHENSNHGIFCVTGKDLECIGIDDLF